MPTIENQITIHAPRERVYSVAKNVEEFPSYMPDVESIEIVERSDDGSGRVVSRWVGLVPEFKQKIRWTEEDFWSDADATCDFRQLQGDYQQYEGEWRFTAADDGRSTLFRSVIRYELEIPLIGPLLKSLIAKKMRDNTDKILAAIKERAESAAL